MAKFRYTGDSGRYWPDYRFKPDGQEQTVQPGDVIEADENPDPSFWAEMTPDQPAEPDQSAEPEQPAGGQEQPEAPAEPTTQEG